MKTRILTGAGLLAFMVLMFFTKSVTPYVFDAFILYMAIVGSIEMSNLMSKFGFYSSRIAIFIYPILSYALFRITTILRLPLNLLVILQVALLLLVAGSVWLISILAKKSSDNEIKTRKITCTLSQFSLYKSVQTLFVMLYPVLILNMLYFMNNIEHLQYALVDITSYTYNASMFFLLYTFIVPIFVDTFAMLTGMIFKGKKLCPKLSPKKTISGAVGGVVWGTGVAVALYFILNSIDSFRVFFLAINLQWWIMLIVGLISSVLCQLGDLFESFIKRRADVKDSGDFLPGHGGLLDRIDSHLANIIVTFIFMLIIL